jgi:intracellular septation protein
MQSASPLSGFKRTLLDFAPLVAFFIGFKYAGLKEATIAMVVATAVALAVIYAFERRIALLPLISGLCVLLFGSLTIYLDNELFIKMRPTIVNALFGAVLLTGVYVRRTGWMSHLFSFAFQLSEQGWLVLSKRWGFFFLGMALLNELVWRSVPTETWVNIKVFGYVAITMVFTLAQFRLIERYAPKEEG